EVLELLEVTQDLQVHEEIGGRSQCQGWLGRQRVRDLPPWGGGPRDRLRRSLRCARHLLGCGPGCPGRRRTVLRRRPERHLAPPRDHDRQHRGGRERERRQRQTPPPPWLSLLPQETHLAQRRLLEPCRHRR